MQLVVKLFVRESQMISPFAPHGLTFFGMMSFCPSSLTVFSTSTTAASDHAFPMFKPRQSHSHHPPNDGGRMVSIHLQFEFE